jgi:hypothetical protein
MMKEMKGVCFLFSETGTEGGWWAMQEDGFTDKDGSWSYEGLQVLEEGDDFTCMPRMAPCYFMASFIETLRPGQFHVRYSTMEN